MTDVKATLERARDARLGDGSHVDQLFADLADRIEAQRIEMSRAGIVAIDSFQSQAARIKRLKSDVQTLCDSSAELLARVTLAERVVEAARWNLPLAKGYAAANPVGSNATYVAELEDRLAAYDKSAK